jgi:glycosyltransferase involved in cell wall biosynthesis
MGSKHAVTAYVRDYTGRSPAKETLEGFTIERRMVSRIPLLRSIVDLVKGVVYVRRHRGEVDVFIAFHLQLAALIVVAGKLMFGSVAVISPRGKEDFSFQGSVLRVWQRFLYRSCDGILIQSEAIRTEFLRSCSTAMSPPEVAGVTKKIRIFPNVIGEINPGHKFPAAPPFEILFVGRLAEIKGVEHLLGAMRDLGSGFRLRIAGDGPERERLQALASGLEVEFLGEVSFLEMASVLGRAHVFVLPSLSENLPNAVLEALAAGLPVVASNVGALPEIIRDGWNGFLVPPGDSRAIATAVRSITRDRIFHEEMSNAATQSSIPFGPGAIIPLWERSLEEIISQCAI